MSKIHILPEQLANQIAAGEVVERPASVVKELLENSLDAGANRIEIEIEGGGTRLIRVIDNGEGMAEDDVLMSLERHGTSKIRNDSDLAAISTLGFRGEAIPSIASVSQMTITSRFAGTELGTQAVLSYGKLIKVHETGTGYGTQFEVRNLFGNTPARRKFLRTARTELAHIDEVVQNYALGSPAVTFILRVDGK
ncbi:MAG: DNA mismatch repair endonuclease MutL, partial [Desulfoprunum sp.]|nr:DNA mismatch repair endonuclease MutL [Desulfoprunum sp.]